MALPSTYRQLAYIQSTGTQYINLNVAPNSVGRMTIDFIPMLASTRQMVVGAWGGTSYVAYLLQLNASNQFLPDMTGVTISGSSKSYVVGTEYLYDCNLNGGTITINGESFKTTSGYSNTSRSYFLFASNDVDDGAYAKASVKLKSLKIYNTSGTLVSDYTPAQRISDNVVGLYDLTTNTFRTNSGSGTFEYGEMFDVTTSVSPTGGGSITGSGTYGQGDTVTVQATANNGYGFMNFHITQATHQITNGYDYDRSNLGVFGATRNYTQVEFNVPTIVTKYSGVNYTDSGYGRTWDMSIRGSNDGVNYTNIQTNTMAITGGTVTVSNTTPYKYYRWYFSRYNNSFENGRYIWDAFTMEGYIDQTVIDNPYNFAITYDTSVAANFYVLHNVTLDYDQTLGTASYSWNSDYTKVNLTAQPNSDGQFVGWYVNSNRISTSLSYTYTVNSDVTIEARFERVYNVDASVDGDGAIQYTRGTDRNDVTFSVIPNQNRHFDRYEVEKAVLSFFPMGVLKSAENVYDEITPTQAIQRIGVVDLGSLTWTYRESGTSVAPYYWAHFTGIKSQGNPNFTKANIKCAKYKTVIRNTTEFVDQTICADGSVTVLSQIQIKDSSVADATALKNSLQGVYLFYELIDPIVNDIQIDLHYSVHQGGTEQLLPVNETSPVTAPLKADIQYPDELRENQYFTYRQCPSTDGEAEITSLKGNTLVWNQLIQNGNFADTNYWSPVGTTITASNNELTIRLNADGGSRGIRQGVSIKANHTYLIHFFEKPNRQVTSRCFFYAEDGNYLSPYFDMLVSANVYNEVIHKITADRDYGYFYIRPASNGLTEDTFLLKNVNIVDLTQMGLDITEPSEFTSLFYLPYYEYNSGSLLSFNATGLKTTGKNLFDFSQFANGTTITFSDGELTATAGALHTAYSNVVINGIPIEYPIDKAVNVSFDARTDQNSTSSGNGIYVRADENGRTWDMFRTSNDTPNIQHMSGYASTARRISKLGFTYGSGGSNIWHITHYQVEIGSVGTEYEPYTESTLTFGYAKQIFTTTPLMLHLTSDIIITAYILDDEHFHITVNPNFEYGSVYISENDVYSGTVVTLWARPFPDYNFVRWGDGSLENPRNIVVTENVTLVAIYQRVGDTNGIYQYRCFVKDQLNLEDPPKAYMRVDTFTVRTDLMTNATSSIKVLEMPSNINEGDVLVLYDPKGQFLYNGVVNSIEDMTIGCSQMQSYYKGNWIYSVSSQDFLEHEIAVILKDYADGKLKGSSYVDALVAERLGGITIDYVGTTTANLPTTYEESGDENEDKYEVVDMEEFIYSLYEKYNIVFDFEINFSGTNYVHIKVPSFEKLKVGNNMFAIQNMLPITEIEETNKLVIYDSNNVYRTTYIATKNGIVENPATTANRFNITNTEIVFSDDPVADLVASNLPSQMFNHKLEYDLIIKNFIYEFGDFNLGGELDIYYGDEYYDSVLTGYEISKQSNQNITQAHFVCGKVRTALTKLLTLSGRV